MILTHLFKDAFWRHRNQSRHSLLISTYFFFGHEEVYKDALVVGGCKTCFTTCFMGAASNVSLHYRLPCVYGTRRAPVYQIELETSSSPAVFFLLFFCILFRKILIYFRLYCSILYEIFVRFLSWNKNKKEGFFFCFYCTKIKVKGSELVFPRMELWGTNPRLSLLAALSCSAASTRLAPREACDEAVLGTEPAVCACLGDKTRLPYILISRDTLLSLRITVVRWDLDACARVAHLNIFHA